LDAKNLSPHHGQLAFLLNRRSLTMMILLTALLLRGSHSPQISEGTFPLHSENWTPFLGSRSLLPSRRCDVRSTFQRGPDLFFDPQDEQFSATAGRLSPCCRPSREAAGFSLVRLRKPKRSLRPRVALSRTIEVPCQNLAGRPGVLTHLL